MCIVDEVGGESVGSGCYVLKGANYKNVVNGKRGREHKIA